MHRAAQSSRMGAHIERPSMPRLTLYTQMIAITALVGLTACASGPKRGGAQGQGGSPQTTAVSTHPIGLYFVEHDANQDRSTSREELDAGLKKDWATFDRNPSAALFQNWTREAFGSSSAMPTFLSFDSNLNGVVSQSEFETRLISEFNRLDRNGDGAIARSELIFNIRQRDRRSQSRDTDELSDGNSRPPRGDRPSR